MIHVQIASELTRSGVRGVRWVLLEDIRPEMPDAAAAPGAAARLASSVGTGTTAQPADGPPPAKGGVDAVADSLRLRALKLLVVALGLGAALWTAAVQIGPPGRKLTVSTVPASAPASEPAPAPALSPAPAPVPAPASASAPATATLPGRAAPPPAAPASADLPRLTASL